MLDVNLIHLLQEVLNKYFPSWNSIKRHREVVFFITGLLPDPKPMVDHVYQMWLDMELNKLRIGSVYIPTIDETIFKSLYAESAVPLPVNPLHNEHINYYHHLEDDENNRPRDTTDVYTPSKLYEFTMMSQNVGCHNKHRHNEGTSQTPECALLILNNGEDTDRNMFTFQQVCHQQPLTDLYLHKLKFNDPHESNMFQMSKNAQSVTLEDCLLPLKTLNYLMEQIAACNTMHKIKIVATSLRGIESFSLTNNITLKYLHLGSTEMSVGMGRKICQQLNHLLCLEHIKISDNSLTGCLQHFVPKAHPGLPSLRELQLRDTGLIHEDLQHLLATIQSDKLPNLRVIDLSYNTLTGCLSSFIPDPHLDLAEQEKLNPKDASLLAKPYPGLSALEELHLSNTELEEADLQCLSDLIKSCKLPELIDLDLSNNRSDRNEEKLNKLKEVCMFHYHGELILDLEGVVQAPVKELLEFIEIARQVDITPLANTLSSSLKEKEDESEEEIEFP